MQGSPAGLAWARARQAATVCLSVANGQAAALGMYRQAGFVAIGAAEPLREGSPVQSHTMHLHLAATP